MASTAIRRAATDPQSSQTTGTFSVWVKKTGQGAYQTIYNHRYNNSYEFKFMFFNDDTLYCLSQQNGTRLELRTRRRFRDPNAWYHIVLAVDSTQGTAADRAKLYINGVQETSFSTATYPTSGQGLGLDGGASYYYNLGSRGDGSSEYFDGVMSHFHFVDGSQLAPTVFGSTDSTTGEWKINTSPSYTVGTKGFFILKDGNSLTDESANSNNFSSYQGTLTKTEDCSSNVFATWNPLFYAGGAVTHSAGNTRFAESGNYWKSTLATIGASTGKYYAEFKCNGNWMIAGVVDLNDTLGYGIVDRNFFSTTYISNQGYGYYNADGTLRYRGSETSYGATYGSGDIVQIALDCDNNRVFFGKNGTWQNSADPTSSGTGFAMTATNPIYTFACSVQNDEVHANFGNGYFNTTAVASAGTNASGIGIFEYDVPTGYTALSTKGLNE